MIRNTVLLYIAQARFEEIVGAIVLAPGQPNGFDGLSGFLPWGSIGQDGELKANDAYQVAGEPIVAVTRVPEDLALASSSATVATKVVLVNGARGLARDLQAFDDIVDRQRVVILASSDETEALDLLRDRGRPIWHMSPDEILIGEAFAGNRARASLVGATIRAADTRQRVKVTMVDCQDSALQAVATSLERAATMIGDSEEVHESEEILARLYGNTPRVQRVLFRCWRRNPRQPASCPGPSSAAWEMAGPGRRRQASRSELWTGERHLQRVVRPGKGRRNAEFHPRRTP